MGSGLLPVPALAGHLPQVHLNPFRFRLLRESGHHVLSRPALAGSVLALSAQPGVHSLGEYIPSLRR